jgi:hypothetical protein
MQHQEASRKKMQLIIKIYVRIVFAAAAKLSEIWHIIKI